VGGGGEHKKKKKIKNTGSRPFRTVREGRVRQWRFEGG